MNRPRNTRIRLALSKLICIDTTCMDDALVANNELCELESRIAELDALLRECDTILAMWADVATAVSLRADIGKALNHK